MGGAKFMGRDYGTSYTKGDMALGVFFLWVVGGIPISFVLSLIILPQPNFMIPILFYILGMVLLWIRYLRVENKNKEIKVEGLNNG